MAPVFWPEEFHGLYSSWGCKESDMTEHVDNRELECLRCHLSSTAPDNSYVWVGPCECIVNKLSVSNTGDHKFCTMQYIFPENFNHQSCKT